MESAEIVGTCFRLYRVEAGYLRCDYSDGAQVTAQDVRERLQATTSLTNGHPTPMLSDIRTVRSVSREARKLGASAVVTSRTATLVESPLSRMIANFYISVSDPRVPTKLFTDLEDAERWLLDA